MGAEQAAKPLTRHLGRSGITVSAMGMGCWAIGGPWWSGDMAVGWGAVDDTESIRAIHCAIDMGVSFFDTADVYGTGHSERLLAQAFQGKRDSVVIASKFGRTFDETSRQMTGSCASEAYIRKACEASLQRLGTDHIDLYQFHLADYNTEQAPIVQGVLEDLVSEGKIRFYGWSTDSVARARVFAQGSKCVAIQHRMSVLECDDAMVDACAELDMASINRGPLGMGLLTGKFGTSSRLDIDDVRGPKGLSWIKYFTDGRPSADWLAKVDALREVLTSGGRTLAQGALAWIWGRSERCIPIPGFRTVAQVEENSRAMEYGPLDEEQMAEVDRILGRQVPRGRDEPDVN